MSDAELENRLQALLSARAAQVGTHLSGPSLRAEATARSAQDGTQQIAPALHESGVPTGSGDLHPTHREDHLMTIDDLRHIDQDRNGEEVPLVISAPAGRRGRRVAAVSGAALAAAAAAVVALVVAPGHGSGSGSQAAAGQPGTTVTTTLGTATGGPWTYVHDTIGGGAGSYQDVWIPANPTTGTWQLSRKDDGGVITQRATCARFPFFQGPSSLSSNSGDGTSPTTSTLPCDASTPWAPYRPPFAESLPTDPHALLAYIRGHGGSTDAEAFETGSDFLSTGWVPKEIASNVLAALRLIPGTVEKSDVSNHAGATGTALTYTGRIKPAVPETWGVIVDSSGEVIGSTFSSSGHATETFGITRTTVDALGATK